MTGAELLALARHTLPDAGDDRVALHLAFALSMLWPQLTPEQRRDPEHLLWQMLDHMPLTNS